MCPSESGSAPATRARCERCGCLLNAYNTGTFCATCDRVIRRSARLCADCREPILSLDGTAIRCPACEKKFRKTARTCRVCGTMFAPYMCRACPPRKKPPKHQDLCLSCHWHTVHEGKARMKESVCSVCGCSFLPHPCVVPGCTSKPTNVCSVCHEEQAHDGLRAEMWTLEDCPRCHKAVEALRALKRKVVLHGLVKLRSGEESDGDALVALVLADGAAPLVKVHGRFLDIREIDDLIEKGVFPEGIQ